MTAGPLSLEDLRHDLATSVFAPADRDGDRFGLEVEQIPIRWPTPERPAPIPLDPTDRCCGIRGPLVEIAEELDLGLQTPDERPPRIASGSGRFTFEPGAQIEYSSAPHTTPAAAYAEVDRVLSRVRARLAESEVELASLGANPWHSLEEIGLHATATRYVAMDAHFARIGPLGQRMMRQTATVHVNVGFGQGETIARRWRASLALAPVALAQFAASPIVAGRWEDAASLRGGAWLGADDSRTGFPPLSLTAESSDPVDEYLHFALDALVFVRREGETWRAVDRSYRFRDWLNGDVDGRPPQLADWHHHLTTLFPEVRPKGFLELRSADAPPAPFHSVPLTWWTALLGDDAVLTAILERRGTNLRRVPDERQRAVRSGLRDPELAADAEWLGGLAAEAVARAPTGWYSAPMIAAFEAYLDRYIRRRRTPSDELRELASPGPIDRSAWREITASWNATGA